MAASRMSRIVGHYGLALLLVIAAAELSSVHSQDNSSENSEDVELISDPQIGSEYIDAFSGADGNPSVSASPYDLKKHNPNKKPQKFYPKTEADWNFQGEGKKTDVFIKDPKDNRLLRLVSESVISPQDVLPIISNDAITSSQKTVNYREMNVTVQPEGMSGVVDDGLTVDSDEKIIIEKKRNGTKERTYPKFENDVSKETDEDVKINLDANAGVQNPHFNKQKDSITVPAQKHISLSRGKEPVAHRKQNDVTFDVIPLNKQKDKLSSNTDEGVFDFIDSPLSNKNLVPAGTAQTSKINVKKGPNGQDYEYEYIYYYYEDGDENNNHNDKSKPNEIPVTSVSPSRSTTPVPNRSTPPQINRHTKPLIEENSGTRIKSHEVINEPISSQIHSSRDKYRPDFRYTMDNSPIYSVSSTPRNNQPNEIVWQYENINNNRFPGRQIPPQTISEQPVVTTVPDTFPSTRQSTRGRVTFNTQPVTTVDDSSFIVTAQPAPTEPPRDNPTRSRTTGSLRQPGLELVDSDSFRTHATNVPIEYDKTYYPTQNFGTSSAKSLKQDSTATQNLPPVSSSPKEIYRLRDQTVDYVTGTERLLPTSPSRTTSSTSTEIIADNTQPQSTLPENSLTTVYGAGLTDKAAHDLYAIYQQTQNEDTVKNTIAQDDRTTIVDEPDNSFVATNPPTTILFTTPTTTSTTTTTTTPAPTTTPTTSTAQSFSPSRGKVRGHPYSRSRHPSTSTESISPSSDTQSETSERPRTRFNSFSRREPSSRTSYGKKGSSTTPAAESDSSVASSSPESSPKYNYYPTSRTRHRAHSNARSENNVTLDSASTSAPVSRPNFSERFNRRRPGFRSTTPAQASTFSEEEGVVKQENDELSSVEPQQSTTFKSVRSKMNLQSSHVRPLRPGPKLNLSGRGRLGTSTSTTPVPLDADTSGSADAPIEQKQSEELNVETENNNSEAISSSTSPSTSSTGHPSALNRLKNRPNRLRATADKGEVTKTQVHQSNVNASPIPSRRPPANHLLPRKKQLTTTTEAQEAKEEKEESSLKPVTEEVVEEASSKSDVEISELQSTAEVSSTTENRLSSLLASRRRNLSRKPGTIAHHNKPSNEES